MVRSWILVLIMFCCATGRAQDVSMLYSASDLEKSANMYSANLREIWEEDFLSRLTKEERQRTGNVTLYLPLMGANKHPLDFYSDSGRRRVFLPIASIRFFDDLGIAFAYYESKGCDLGLVSDYAAVLRHRPGEATGRPLEALGVPLDALMDPFVDDLSHKILKSAMFFVAAHEYAHVMYRHKSYSAITAKEAQAQAQEIEADAFALDTMRRIGIPPLAMTYFFLIASRLEPNPGESVSSARQRATHPVSASRIQKMADGIEYNVDAFAQLQADPAKTKRTLREFVPKLRTIGSTLDDPQMRLFLAERARSIDVAALKRGCARK